MEGSLANEASLPARGTRVQRLRLATGLILFAYVAVHYLNHALGHVSIEAMEAMRAPVAAVVGSVVGQVALYGSLTIHFLLGLGSLANLRDWRRPVWQWAQLILGLSIPLLLASHIAYTRLAQSLVGVEVNYRQELALLWPGAWISQSLLLLVVWVHAMLGLHYWLRLRPWYPRWNKALVMTAALVPTVAMTGWLSAARRQHEVAIAKAGETAGDGLVGADPMILSLVPIVEIAQVAVLVAIAAALLAALVLWVVRHIVRRVRVDYGNGVVANAASGATLLEVSRSAGVPHMAVCGGRARCSTCRTLVVQGIANLSPPGEGERALLTRVGADPRVRLACQARVTGPVEVRPMLHPQSGVLSGRSLDPLGWGVERDITVMFLDIRGFSRIAERALPYDVIYLLNSLFARVGDAVERHGGYVDKYMGDGMMSLFGLSADPRLAARQAIAAAIAAHEAAEATSLTLGQHLREPIRLGIGLHGGHSVIGRVGSSADPSLARLTAIGGTVNIASRLEAATKELACPLVVSEQVLAAAAIELPEGCGTSHSLIAHNISEPIAAVGVRDLHALAGALAQAAADEAVPVSAANRLRLAIGAPWTRTTSAM